MNEVNYNTAVFFLNQLLVADPLLIDGRTELDMLHFLTEFASLINFYDSDNKINGNWSPFLLKDPFFLLATISKNKFTERYSLYQYTCSTLKNKLLQKNESVPDKEAISASFNKLFDQLISVFMDIKGWVFYMQRSDEAYQLKTYVINQVTMKFSKYFWAVITLRQNLFLSSIMVGIDPNDRDKFLFFDSYDEMVWKENKDKSPYWEILHLKYPIKENNELDFFQSLIKIGDELFEFFNSIIHHSTIAFKQLRLKSGYPDTILLRTFIHLLKIHQTQLNEISGKHLEFYYKNILHQKKLAAVPDNVFICAELIKKDTTFNLSKGILFNAGLDAQKKPILFETSESSNLNPATIIKAYTLAQLKTGLSSSFYLQDNLNPGKIQKDRNGQIEKWDTFGGKLIPSSTLVEFGIAFSSPMLLLKEGQRNILLTMVFEKKIDGQFLQNAIFYLSTKLAWLPVIHVVSEGESTTATVQIILDPLQPSIECFTINPAEVGNACWPVLKIKFNSFLNDSECVAPVLKSLEIKLDVSAIKNLQLYNDFGLLNTKVACQPFGPSPLLNNSFLIGSNEIFSKPLSAFGFELAWDTLPDDFAVYYQQYNDFLSPIPNKKSISFWKKIWNKTKEIFRRIPVLLLVTEKKLINNDCFTANIFILENKTWNAFNMLKQNTCALQNDNTFKCVPYKIIDDNKLISTIGYPLFTKDSTVGNDKISISSFYAYQPPPDGKIAFACDPTLQNAELKFTENTTVGFIKIILTGPVFGFGSAIYPAIIYNTALDNAKIIIQKDKNIPVKLQPNVPFVPTLKNVTAHYSASANHTFNNDKNTYPIQVFLYSPFEQHSVYDSAKITNSIDYAVDRSIGGNNENIGGLPLFKSFLYNGYLLLEMKNLISTNSINLYFELTREYIYKDENEIVDCYCLSKKGWTKLLILKDGTNNLSCTGIIQVNVPEDISNGNFLNSNSNFWICLATKGSPLSYAQTVFLTTNGIELIRSWKESSTYADTQPKLIQNIITNPKNEIPSIATFIQPFPSFGGRAAENNETKNQRVSYRLKTKDRAITAIDFFLLIKQQFNEVFYSKSIFNSETKNIEIYVLKYGDNYLDPNAFIPLISSNKIKEVKTFLSERVSALCTINVANFTFQYVQLVMTISIKAGFKIESIQAKINTAVNIFLSPWVKNKSKQILIDQPISAAQIAGFLLDIEGILIVESISFQIYDQSANQDKLEDKITFANKQIISPIAPSTIFISYMDHIINIIL